jgi:hypothetical protein
MPTQLLQARCSKFVLSVDLARHFSFMNLFPTEWVHAFIKVCIYGGQLEVSTPSRNYLISKVGGPSSLEALIS